MVRTTLIIILLSIALPLASLSQELKVYAQESNPPANKVAEPGHFIRRWLTLGPIVEGEAAPTAVNIDYLLSASGISEAKFATLEGAPKAGDLVVFKPKGYLAQPRAWQVMELPENHDLDSMLIKEGSVDNAVAYLLTFIESKAASRRQLLLGSDDALKVWLNGEVAHTVALDRSLTIDQDLVSVTLKQGMNCLMLKVADGVVAWQLTARFKDESGLQFFDSPSGQILPLGQRIPQLSSFQLEAPTAEPGQGKEGVWRTYQYVDGLADNWINAMIQDKNGAIWFGTTSGVSKFDGKNWKTYTQREGLADNRVQSLIQDTEGKIWVGTENGVSVFDEAKKSWKNYSQKDGLAHPKVLKVFQDQAGNFWFATGGGGISRFDEKNSNWSTYSQKEGRAGEVVQTVTQDKEGSIWIGTWGSGVSRFDLKTKSWKTYTQKDGLADNRVHDIMKDQDRAVWFATDNGVSRLELKADGSQRTESWKTYTKKDGLADSRVHDIMQDKEGRFWFGTWNGVSCLELKADGSQRTESWKTYTQKDGLVKNLVHVMLQDREGAFWFGTWYNGVSRFEERNWKVYTQKDGLANNAVHQIIKDPEGSGGTLWFATKDGLSRLELKTNRWRTYTQKEGLADNAFYDIIKDRQGWLWFGAYSGISRFDGKLWKNYLDPELDEKWVHCILEDKEGKIWFGTESAGAVCFDPKTNSWKTYTQKDGLTSDAVHDIMQDKEGRIWLATDGGGVCQLEFEGQSQSWKAFSQKDRLANKSVRTLMQDKEGAIWFGTRGGISRFDPKTNSWKTYTQKDGLANDQVFAMVQDEDGIIWIGTDNGGVSKFDGRCFQTLDSKDGLPNDFVVCIYIDKNDKNDQVWFGTEGGAVRYIPEKTPPPIYINRVLTDTDEPYENPKNGISLKAGSSRLTLSYHAISFKTRPGNIKYFYQLTGTSIPVETTRRVVSTYTDDNWQGPTNSETVEYFKLKPGKHIFRVQAVDKDLNYSKIASLEFTLPPLWHQLAWVRGVIALSGLSFFLAFGFVLWHWLASRIATRRLEAQLREQEVHQAQLQVLRYQLNPHFLFNALSSLRNFIDEDGYIAKKIVTELSDYLRYSLINTGLSEVPLKDEFEAIRNFLVIQKIRFEEQLETAIEVEAAAEKCYLPSFLIQPLVENAVKYGMQTSSMPLKVKIAAYVKDGWLQVEVANTGNWIQPAESKSSGKTSRTGEGADPARLIGTAGTAGTAGTRIGIQNVQERLKHAFPNRHSFEILEQNGWVHVVIKIQLLFLSPYGL